MRAGLGVAVGVVMGVCFALLIALLAGSAGSGQPQPSSYHHQQQHGLEGK